MTDTRSTCPYCGVGCGVIIESSGRQITGVRGDPDHPANFGRLCTKGSTLALTATDAVNRQARLLTPQRRFARDTLPQPVSWGEALDHAVGRFESIINEHGPDSVAFYVSGQLLTEDYYVFNKLAKGLIGTNNIDTNSRLCMSSAVAGYKMTLGADAPPACYEDLSLAKVLFITGSNMAFAHPILFRRIEDAKRANPDLKIIVADPRRTETADVADLHLPLLPGTDVALCNAMLHVMLWEGLTDNAYIAAHTSGFDELKARVRDFVPKDVAKLCGVNEADLVQAAKWFAAGPTLSLYCQGLNQSSSGSHKNAALINLHLATGQIGKPGAGPFSLTGQPNAMGGREVGGMANLLSGHRDLSNPEHRAEVAALWGVESVPSERGKTAVELFQSIEAGQIKAVWIACTNPAQSMPDLTSVQRALRRAEFVVVQEAFSGTVTCDFADLLLPATSWGEKDGTVTNSERRITRVRPAVPAPGDARHDWDIVTSFARRLEERLRPGQGTLFPYPTAESVWNEHRETTRGRDLDITGLSYEIIEREPSLWPYPKGASAGRQRLYEDGVFATPDGRARFVSAGNTALAEVRDARYPFSLNTGRLRDQWHAMSRTGTVARLFGHVPEPSVEMNRQDMVRGGLHDGDLVYVTSRRGSLVIPVRGSPQQMPAQVFIAMHWGPEYLSGLASSGGRLAGINALTTNAIDPQSLQPELKHCAVKVLKAELPWRALGVAWIDEDRVLEVREELKAMMGLFPFATCVPFGRERMGVLFRAASHDAPDKGILDRLESLLGLSQQGVLHYNDAKKGQRRAMKLVPYGSDAHLDGFLLAGDIGAEAWIKALLQDELPAQAYGRSLLVPGAKPPAALASADRGKQVCSCFNVREAEISAELAGLGGSPEERLSRLQSDLKCGTNCGSCVPELKRMIRLQPYAVGGVAALQGTVH